LAYEAYAAAVNGADELLLFPIISNGLACRLDAAGQGGVRDRAARPELLDQLVLGHQPVGIAYEVDQQLEDLWLDGSQRAFPPQLERRKIKLAVREQNHGRFGHIHPLATTGRNTRPSKPGKTTLSPEFPWIPAKLRLAAPPKDSAT